MHTHRVVSNAAPAGFHWYNGISVSPPHPNPNSKSVEGGPLNHSFIAHVFEDMWEARGDIPLHTQNSTASLELQYWIQHKDLSRNKSQSKIQIMLHLTHQAQDSGLCRRTLLSHPEHI